MNLQLLEKIVWTDIDSRKVAKKPCVCDCTLLVAKVGMLQGPPQLFDDGVNQPDCNLTCRPLGSHSCCNGCYSLDCFVPPFPTCFQHYPNNEWAALFYRITPREAYDLFSHKHDARIVWFKAHH
jgi:hypothetical protein